MYNVVKQLTLYFMTKTALTIHDVAALCHEANRTYCQILGDNSQLPWHEAPDWQRESAVDGVLFHLDHPEASDAASHESWLAQKRADGWEYGPEKDPAKKRHPCCVPFAELPVAQQVKDSLFKAVVHATRKLVFGHQSKLEVFAGKMYATYCAAVGGKAFNGDPPSQRLD